MFPRFGVGGMVTLGGNDHRYNAFMSYTAAAGLTKVRGAHALKAGFEGRMLRVNVWEARSAGTFNFRTNETQGPSPDHRQQHRRLRLRVVPARHGAAERRADPELEERRGQQLLLGRLRPGRLAAQLAADAQPRRALRHRRAAHRALRPDELLRSGRAFAARRSGCRRSGSARRRRVRRRRRAQPLSGTTGTPTTSRRVSALSYQAE